MRPNILLLLLGLLAAAWARLGGEQAGLSHRSPLAPPLPRKANMSPPLPSKANTSTPPKNPLPQTNGVAAPGTVALSRTR